MTIVDAFLIPIVPLVAGLLAIVVANIKKHNTYSPLLAFGYMLVSSAIVMWAGILLLSAPSMVRGI